MRALLNLPKLPVSYVYEQEYEYWPWGMLLKVVVNWVSSNAPQSAFILDYMCGTGYLLNQMSAFRPDLKLAGCSNTKSYLNYGRRKYSNLDLVLQDAMKFKPRSMPAITMCMAGLHHLERSIHSRFIDKVASELSSNNYFLLGEEIIADYKSEKERKIAVQELCSQLLAYVIKADAPRKVIEAVIDVLGNDLFERGEYKTSIDNINNLLRSHFVIEDIKHVWPIGPYSFGDYLFICRKK